MRKSCAPSKFKPPLRVGAVTGASPQPPVGAAAAGAAAAPAARSTDFVACNAPEGTRQHTNIDDQDDDGAHGVRSDRTAAATTSANAVLLPVASAPSPLAAVTNTFKTSVGPPPSKRMRQAPFGTPLVRVVAAASTPPVIARYFKCMYRKSSRKVHKAWEGDGFLECRGAFVTIKDEEGKDVSKVLIGWSRAVFLSRFTFPCSSSVFHCRSTESIHHPCRVGKHHARHLRPLARY